jgi:hypothetical protein
VRVGHAAYRWNLATRRLLIEHIATVVLVPHRWLTFLFGDFFNAQ